MHKLILLFIPFLLFAYSDNRGFNLKKMKEEQRVALIIGNNNYKSLSKLKNPINDARVMRDILETKGFEVIYQENTTKVKFKKAIKKFSTKLSRGGVGFFYFAGHGLQVNGENYLVATNSDVSDKDEVEFETIALNYVTKKMRNAHNRLNIVVLDACRNDPFSRSGGGGLAPVQNAKGMFVAYATEAGNVAKDGAGENGVFTKNLIKHINKPIPIEQVFKYTRSDVYEETNGEQSPGVYNQIMGDFYFTIPDGTVEYQKPKAKVQKQSSFSFESNKPSTYSLTVNTTPYNAKVAITNIRPKYYDGIKLETGNYTIKVSADGYYSKTGNVNLHSDLNLNINLDKKLVEQNIIKDKYGNIYEIVTSPYTGKIWLDRNLGAKRVCQSYDDEQCFGDYFQWGRDADGHEKKYSSTTSSLSYSDSPNHSSYIVVKRDTNNNDWRSGQNNNLWQGLNGINNPCPKDFRVPTIEELQDETIYKNVNNNRDGFYNFLKFPSSGLKHSDGKSVAGIGKKCDIWSSSIHDKRAYNLLFKENKIYKYDSTNRRHGMAVRCIKD